MKTRIVMIVALGLAGPGCIVAAEEPIGVAAQREEALTPAEAALEPGPPERAPQTIPTRLSIPLSHGAILFAQIGACRHVGSSNAAAIMCMLAVLQNMSE